MLVPNTQVPFSLRPDVQNLLDWAFKAVEANKSPDWEFLGKALAETADPNISRVWEPCEKCGDLRSVCMVSGDTANCLCF
jgi:hypothetical protein